MEKTNNTKSIHAKIFNNLSIKIHIISALDMILLLCCLYLMMFLNIMMLYFLLLNIFCIIKIILLYRFLYSEKIKNSFVFYWSYDKEQQTLPLNQNDNLKKWLFVNTIIINSLLFFGIFTLIIFCIFYGLCYVYTIFILIILAIVDHAEVYAISTWLHKAGAKSVIALNANTVKT